MFMIISGHLNLFHSKHLPYSLTTVLSFAGLLPVSSFAQNNFNSITATPIVLETVPGPLSSNTLNIATDNNLPAVQSVIIEPVPVQPTATQAAIANKVSVISAEEPTGIIDKTIRWVDISHAATETYLNAKARFLDGYLADAPASDDARAQVRVLLDTTFDRYNRPSISLRLRGSLKLPKASKRLRLMFGNDQLDDEQRVGIATQNVGSLNNTSIVPNRLGQPGPFGNSNLRQVNEQALRDNASIALRWLVPWAKVIQTSADLGIRSNMDVYARARATKHWDFPTEDINTFVRQTLRYGSRSQLYSRTEYQVNYQPESAPLLSNLSSITYEDEQKPLGLQWANQLSREEHFFKDHTLSYGLYAGGHTRHGLSTDSYGPWVSWRQNAFRDWFWVRTDLNYLNDKLNHRPHYLSFLLRLETVF